jgi:hypothetical protein
MSAQIQTVVGRFYDNNYKLMESGKKAMLMISSCDERLDDDRPRFSLENACEISEMERC